LGELALQLLWVKETLRSPQNTTMPEELPESPEGQLLAEVALQLYALYLMNGLPAGDESCLCTHTPRSIQ
jgi:hypothetical protein